MVNRKYILRTFQRNKIEIKNLKYKILYWNRGNKQIEIYDSSENKQICIVYKTIFTCNEKWDLKKE